MSLKKSAEIGSDLPSVNAADQRLQQGFPPVLLGIKERKRRKKKSKRKK